MNFSNQKKRWRRESEERKEMLPCWFTQCSRLYWKEIYLRKTNAAIISYVKSSRITTCVIKKMKKGTQCTKTMCVFVSIISEFYWGVWSWFARLYKNLLFLSFRSDLWFCNIFIWMTNWKCCLIFLTDEHLCPAIWLSLGYDCLVCSQWFCNPHSIFCVWNSKKYKKKLE